MTVAVFTQLPALPQVGVTQEEKAIQWEQVAIGHAPSKDASPTSAPSKNQATLSGPSTVRVNRVSKIVITIPVRGQTPIPPDFGASTPYTPHTHILNTFEAVIAVHRDDPESPSPPRVFGLLDDTGMEEAHKLCPTWTAYHLRRGRISLFASQVSPGT